MITNIHWPVCEDRLFLGHNGHGKCTGLEISQFEGVVEIRPITTKNVIGSAHLCLPITSMPQMIKTLGRLRQEKPR